MRRRKSQITPHAHVTRKTPRVVERPSRHRNSDGSDRTTRLRRWYPGGWNVSHGRNANNQRFVLPGCQGPQTGLDWIGCKSTTPTGCNIHPPLEKLLNFVGAGASVPFCRCFLQQTFADRDRLTLILHWLILSTMPTESVRRLHITQHDMKKYMTSQQPPLTSYRPIL